jgi:Holliday junction resolvase RusA-like endonuclease
LPDETQINNWVGNDLVRARVNGSNWQFEIKQVTSQSRVYKQSLHQFFREYLPLTPVSGEFEVAIKILINPDFPQIDVDNVAKAVLDGVKGRVFIDDCQIMRLLVEKEFATEEKIEIAIWRRENKGYN